jgi:hypothetical protein
MSDLPAKEFGSGIYRLSGDTSAPRAAAPSKPTVKVVDPRRAVAAQAAVKPVTPAAWPHLIGLGLMVAACLLGAASPGTWHKLVSWGDRSWSSETWRWIAVALLATTGVSFLQTRPIFFVITAGECALALFCVDVLLDSKATRWTEALVGANRAPLVLLIVSAAFGCLAYADARARQPHLRGILGLLIIATAALGMSLGWFNWSQRTHYLEGWGQEAAWATVLLLTAIGVSISRGRPIQLLIALILASLAYSCVHAGYAKEISFPELSTPTQIIKIDHESYANVDAWRWVVCGELACLSIVLVHLSLGIGAMTVIFAAAWMVVGLSLYNAVGTLNVFRIADAGAAQAASGPLTNMGLPVAQAPNSSVPTAGTPVLSPAQRRALDERNLRLQREATFCEVTTFAWMLCTALLAGVICVAGLRMLSDDRSYRATACAVILVSFLAGVVLLARVWETDAGQSWEKWLAAFKFSRHHRYIYWLAFGASLSLFGTWALMGRRPVTHWINMAIAVIIVGTMASLVAAAVMIRYGGFSPLPVWVYCLMAAGQSSLAWVLLFHLKPATRAAPIISHY